jgi:hypothetical protein
LRVVILWLTIAVIVIAGIELGIDEKVIGIAVAVFGVATHAFTSLLALIALVPFLGPLLVKILTLPFFWILNGVGYWLSILAIKRGYAKEVVNYRVLTFAFLLGTLLGYVLGKIL